MSDPGGLTGPEKPMAQQDSGVTEAPVLTLLSAVVFPNMIASVQVGRDKNIALIDGVQKGELIGLILQKNQEVLDPRASDLFRIGITGRILNKMRLSENLYQVFVQGLDRIMLETFLDWEPFITARLRVLRSTGPSEKALKPLCDRILSSLEHFISLAPRVPAEVFDIIRMNADSGGRLADLIATHIPFELRDRQQILEALDAEHRLEIILEMVEREIENIRVINDVTDIAKEELDAQHRRQFLRRQLKTIQKELGEDPDQKRIEELRERIEAVSMPPAAAAQAQKELSRLEGMLPSSSEYSVALSYLDWILEMPWETMTEDNTNFERARDILDRHHFGLEDVKERILEFLAVRYLRRDVRGPILCFSGPPGVGKTSLGKAIAESLGRAFARMSVGGMRDESEIRGHRRTYVGAMPGRIVQNLRQAGMSNPVFMIDEIDKMGSDFRGDPSSALLEVLDPEQNIAFYDQYLDLPINLSRVFFIATANVLANIPAPLRDRMEVIELPGYIEQEKVEIARRHLLPRQLESTGLTAEDLQFSNAALLRIVRNYTREAGVRNLERQLSNVCRKTAKRIVSGNTGKLHVTVKQLRSLLGPRSFEREGAAAEDAVGVATALAWTQFGGEILFVEALDSPGPGGLKLTGQIGEVMRESAEAAVTYVKAHAGELGIDPKSFSERSIHVHLPAGAVQKDGPSAGLALVIAIASLMTGRPADHTVAMTGEITLTGKVLAIGGLKDKAIAAHRAGISKIIVPQRNMEELEQLPDEVRKGLEFLPVQRISEAIAIALKD
ncbi:MAG TPA: endopeptidase La [Acidobacteriota bacterium]|nr:endopeptidase La [Acidobacteriota bacterium]